MLIEPGQELCFQCHDQEEVLANENHEEIEDTACWECHDPHYADNEKLIR